MTFDDTWHEIRTRCESYPEYVTPLSGRAFTVDATHQNRIDVVFEDGSQRALWREQFELLVDRLESERRISLSDLAPGVEPYVSLLSLLSQYGVDESSDALRVTSDSTTESPLAVEERERTDEERIEADTLLLRDMLRRYDVDQLDDLTTDTLVDLYVLLSDVQYEADDVRQVVRDALLERMADGRLHGTFGTVTEATREIRHLKEEDEVLAALDELGIPHEWVLGIDREKLDVVLSVTDLDEESVYNVEEQVYVQKTGVDEEAKKARLGGLRNRLYGEESEAAAELRDELEELERRIDELLTAD